MNALSQLIIIIAIIVLLLYLINKVIKLIVKIVIIGLGLILIFYVLNIFFIQTNLSEVNGRGMVFVLKDEEDSVLATINCSDEETGSASLLSSNLSLKELKREKRDFPVVVLNSKTKLFNRTLISEISTKKENQDYEKICTTLREAINETSLFRLTFMYFLGNLKLYPKTKIGKVNITSLKLKNNSNIISKIAGVMRI